MELTAQQRAVLEEDLVDTLIAWKKKTDAMAGDIAAAREAMAKAKKFRIWEGKYSSFKEWLERECGISQSWAYGLISAAKTIECIEDSAAKVIEQKAAVNGEDSAQVAEDFGKKIRGLPLKSLKALKTLKPLKAVELVAPAVVDDDEIIKRIQAAATEKPQKVEVSDHRKEVLEQFDAEWTTLKRGAAYVPMTPETVYLALRKVLEKVL